MEKVLSYKQKTNWKKSLSAAEKIYSKELCILDVRLDIHDGSPALKRLTESLGKKVH